MKKAVFAFFATLEINPALSRILFLLFFKQDVSTIFDCGSIYYKSVSDST